MAAYAMLFDDKDHPFSHLESDVWITDFLDYKKNTTLTESLFDTLPLSTKKEDHVLQIKPACTNNKLDDGKKRSRPEDCQKEYINLSVEEERQIKRQKRLIKNRESAQLSRQRKKQYIEDLESKVTILTSNNENLEAKLVDVTSKNLQLEEEIQMLRKLLNSKENAQF